LSRCSTNGPAQRHPDDANVIDGGELMFEVFLARGEKCDGRHFSRDLAAIDAVT
jgi:hypothetical protein